MDIHSSTSAVGFLLDSGRVLLPAADRAAEPAVLADRSDATVVRLGNTVLKAHDPDTDRAALEARLLTAADPRLRAAVLPPLPVAGSGRLLLPAGGLLLTAWPAGEPVDPEEPDQAPWESAAALLAHVHATTPPTGLPAMRGPVKVARALRRLHDTAAAHPAADGIRAAGATLPAWARGEAPAPVVGPPRLVHGDFHLGQLVRLPVPVAMDRYAGWRLIDVDDLGVGDPAWDLARPAAWYAAGLLPADPWERFLTAYRESGGCAVPGGARDPWATLEVPARALVVQLAALGLARAVRRGREPDEAEQLLFAACERIARTASSVQ